VFSLARRALRLYSYCRSTIRENAMPEKIADRMRDISPFYCDGTVATAPKQFGTARARCPSHGIGEPGFRHPPGRGRRRHRVYSRRGVKYTPAAGLPELRTQIAAFYRKALTAVTVPMERISSTPAHPGALLLAFGLVWNPRREVLMADPCYPCNSKFYPLFAGERCGRVDAQTRYQLSAD